MAELSEQFYLIMVFIYPNGKPVQEVFSYRPAGVVWDDRETYDIITRMEWSELIKEVDDVILLTPYGESVLKQHKKFLARKKYKETISSIKDYLNIVVFVITIVTAIATSVTALKSLHSNQKRIFELEQEVLRLKYHQDQSTDNK